MSTFCKNEWKPAGWSLVAGKFKGTSKTYFYLIRGNLKCSTPLTLQCPASEDGFVYSNPFTIEHELVHIGGHVDQATVQNLGFFLPSERELRVLVGDELKNTTTNYAWSDVTYVKNSSKIKEAVVEWQKRYLGDPSLGKVVTVKNGEGIKVRVGEETNVMGMNCGCKNEGTGMGMSALGEVLFYWHDEVHDRIDEIIGKETAAVHEASAKKAFVEQMAEQIVTFERQGGESTAEFEAMAERRAERLRSLLMDWVEVPKVENDKVRRLERMRKDAFARLEEEFESLFVRAKIVQPGDEEHWLGAVGIYVGNGFDFDIEGDARRLLIAATPQ